MRYRILRGIGVFLATAALSLSLSDNGAAGEDVRTTIAAIEADVVDMQALYEADILPHSMKRAKVILSGEIGVAKTLNGIRATKGAREAIEKAGGSVEA